MARSVKGKNGQLFLADDTNRVLDQIGGALVIEPNALRSIRASHRERHKMTASIGAKYRHLIAPNKESALAHLLPEPYRFAEGAAIVDQVLPIQGTFYSRACMAEFAAKNPAYIREDTHWTEVGAAHYFRCALEFYGETLPFETIRGEIDQYADLVGATRRFPTERPVRLSSRVVSENDLTNHGHFRHVVASVGTERALVLHDSSAHALMPMLDEMYAEVIYVHTADLDPNFLTEFRPDVLWFIQIERFLERVPRNDLVLADLISEQFARKEPTFRQSSDSR